MLKAHLEKKKELVDNIFHNKMELMNLSRMEKAEKKISNQLLISRAIRRGKQIISLQKTELRNYSCAKIAEATGIESYTVNYQYHKLVGDRL